jgi:hypothetical protein
MIFDSTNPTTGNEDIGSPNQQFGGEGVGTGGEDISGNEGVNSMYLNKVLVISEDGNSRVPKSKSSYETTGEIIFTFDCPSVLNEIHLLDADEPGIIIVTYDSKNNVISSVTVPNLGQNNFQIIEINERSVKKFKVVFTRKCAIAKLLYKICCHQEEENICLEDVCIDFDNFEAGETELTFNDFTISVETEDQQNHKLMIFDSENPTGNDFDLGTPNETFSNGPGIGLGGKIGQYGANSKPLGKVMIISEDNNSNDPDDYTGSSTMTFNFDCAIIFDYVDILDVDEGCGDLSLLDKNDNILKTLCIMNYGDNSYQRIKFIVNNVWKIEVNLPGSGAIAELCYSRCKKPIIPTQLGAISLGRNWLFGNSQSGGAGNVGLEISLSSFSPSLVIKFMRDFSMTEDKIKSIAFLVYSNKEINIRMVLYGCNHGGSATNINHGANSITVKETLLGECPQLIKYVFPQPVLLTKDCIEVFFENISDGTVSVGIWQLIVEN